jgi:hypothetical protein
MNQYTSNYLPPNWREFYILAEYAKKAAWTKMPRKYEEHAYRQNRSVYKSGIRDPLYYSLHQAQQTLKYDLKTYFGNTSFYQPKLDEFFAEEEKKHSLQVACHTDAPYLGFLAPEIKLNLFSKSTFQQTKKSLLLCGNKHLDITQSFESVIATKEQIGPSITEVYLNKKIDQTKRDDVLREACKQSLVTALVYRNADNMSLDNVIVTDIEQEKPQKLCMFDYEYAGRDSISDILNAADEAFNGFFSLYKDWREVLLDLETVSKKAEENRSNIGNERTNMYQENISDALNCIQKRGKLLSGPRSLFSIIQIATMPFGK